MQRSIPAGCSFLFLVNWGSQHEVVEGVLPKLAKKYISALRQLGDSGLLRRHRLSGIAGYAVAAEGKIAGTGCRCAF